MQRGAAAVRDPVSDGVSSPSSLTRQEAGECCVVGLQFGLQNFLTASLRASGCQAEAQPCQPLMVLTAASLTPNR
jgi:hypothetical protein